MAKLQDTDVGDSVLKYYRGMSLQIWHIKCLFYQLSPGDKGKLDINHQN